MRTRRSELPPLVVERSFLSASECRTFREIHNHRTRYYRSDSERFTRRVDVAYVNRDLAPTLFPQIESLAKRINVWGLALDCVGDDMRIQRYRRNDYTELHSDYDHNTQDFSKLTVVIPLVDRREWEGGELQVGNSLRVARLRMGDAAVFPSFSPHRVTRVTKGTRVVLTAWVVGPPLR
jgi:predicted 2-oxoglutarate/Fe(II)-dependent dioxygenase YbiX